MNGVSQRIVEADPRDGTFPREETVLAHGLTLFDGLYASVGER